MKAFDIWQHWLENFVLEQEDARAVGDERDGARSGNDGTYMVSSSSFALLSGAHRRGARGARAARRTGIPDTCAGRQ
jgi:hypothetical protein